MAARTFRYAGKTYPSRLTMGAYVRFKDVAGYDVTKVENMDSVGMAILLWAAITSASAVDGIKFDEPFDRFADRVMPEDVATWFSDGEELAEEDADEAKKKTPKA